MPRILIRSLMLLMVVRVLGAPVALRPTAHTDHSGGSLVFRVCTWPEQRLSPADLFPIDEAAGAALLNTPALPQISCSSISPLAEPLLSDARYVRRALGVLRC